MTNKAQEIIQAWYASAEEIKTSCVSLLMEYPQIDGPLTILSGNFEIDKAALLGYIILSLPLVLVIVLYIIGGKIRYDCYLVIVRRYSSQIHAHEY